MKIRRSPAVRLVIMIAFLLSSILIPAAVFAAASPDAEDQENDGKYVEAPPVFVTGNVVAGRALKFFPKGKWEAGLYDSDGDLVPDTQINDFSSFANGANNILNEAIAACVVHGPGDRRIYDNPDIWTDDQGASALNLRPDVMPEFADTTGTPTTFNTQFIQIAYPFKVDPHSVFDSNNPANNFLSGEIVFRDENDNPVACAAFLNGYDAFGNYHGNDPNWPVVAVRSWRVLVVFAVTPSGAGAPGIPTVPTAFTASDTTPGQWQGKEVRIRTGTLRDRQGNSISVDSMHLVRRSGVDVADDDTVLAVRDIIPSKFIFNPFTGSPLQDNWPGVPAQESLCLLPGSEFKIIFNKPVVPATVGRSIVFNKAPFTGNMRPLPNPEAGPNPDPACTGSIEPICTNVVLRAVLHDDQGVPLDLDTPIPFRVHPVSQNNLAAYVVRPLIDLPGSSTDWTGDLPGDPPTPPVDSLRMRIEVIVCEYQANTLTGATHPSQSPQNLAVAGFHGERFFNNGANIVRAFSVIRGRYFINAPVSPNVMYYSMGRGGIGAIDLNGNGFNTNRPGFDRPLWVTASTYYSPVGNGMMGMGNDYAYPVGLGRWTPIPGINEGSSGWWNNLDPAKDALVRDSRGRARLYPNPAVSSNRPEITDIVVGDFLDTIYFNKANPYASDQNRLDLIFVQAPGYYSNNLISSPPTPNPPPLSIPVGMRPVDVVMDDISLEQDSAFVILGREVFPPDLTFVPLFGRRQWIHLDPAGLSGGADQPFPPNPPGLGPWAPGNFIQNGPMASTNTLGVAYSYASRQQIGNFLFATDKSGNKVHVLNSNTMEKITSIEGFEDPEGLALTPDLRTLYVVNAANDSVSVVDADPRSVTFLELRAEIPVGTHPRGICCQPDMEDVLVCNFGSDSVTIINPATNTVRKTLTYLIDKPWDVVATPRQHTFGWGTQVYHAYISNHGGDNVLVYESGPDGLGGIGHNDIMGEVPTTIFEPILKPRGLCYDPLYLNNQPGATNLTGGCFVAHSSTKGAAVSRINFVTQSAPWGPIYGGGYGRRDFLVTAQWTSGGGDLSSAGAATDVALLDFNRFAWINQNFSGNAYVTNWGAVGNNPNYNLPVNNKHPLRILSGTHLPTWFPDLLFISYSDISTVDVLDLNTGAASSITGLPAPVRRLMSYFKD